MLMVALMTLMTGTSAVEIIGGIVGIMGAARRQAVDMRGLVVPTTPAATTLHSSSCMPASALLLLGFYDAKTSRSVSFLAKTGSIGSWSKAGGSWPVGAMISFLKEGK